MFGLFEPSECPRPYTEKHLDKDILRFAVKPTSSILVPQKSINTKGKEVMVRTKGRHDPCVGIRAVPIGEAMMAVVLADHFLRNKIYLQD